MEGRKGREGRKEGTKEKKKRKGRKERRKEVRKDHLARHDNVCLESIPAIERERLEDLEFEARFGYVIS